MNEKLQLLYSGVINKKSWQFSKGIFGKWGPTQRKLKKSEVPYLLCTTINCAIFFSISQEIPIVMAIFKVHAVKCLKISVSLHRTDQKNFQIIHMWHLPRHCTYRLEIFQTFNQVQSYLIVYFPTNLYLGNCTSAASFFVPIQHLL